MLIKDVFGFEQLGPILFMIIFTIHFQWDPMITTLPGLYLFSVGVIKPVTVMMEGNMLRACSTYWLRSINILFAAGNFYLIYALLKKLHNPVLVCIRRMLHRILHSPHLLVVHSASETICLFVNELTMLLVNVSLKFQTLSSNI